VYCPLWIHSTRPYTQPSSLCGNKEAVTWSCAWSKAWNLAQRLDSPPWQCSSSQGAPCEAVSGQKIDYWTGTPILFPYLVPNDFWLFQKMKSSLRRLRFQDIEDIQKKKKWRHWKLFHNRSSKNVSNRCKYAGMLAIKIIPGTS
jgi:hypothetical protein